jgi:hypothetical protein
VSLLTGVLDANVAIGLAKGEVFDRLASLYQTLCLAPAVKSEVISQGQGLAGAAELAKALGLWVIEFPPDPKTLQLIP